MTTGKKTLSFDFATCFGRGGITRRIWKKGAKKAEAARRRLAGEVEKGSLGFYKLPAAYRRKPMLAPLLKAAERLRRDFDNLVVIGIGGSALGGRMLFNALCHRCHNELPGEKRGGLRLYFLENIDPDSFNDLLSHIDLSRTAFNVVSKSGSTVEPISQFVAVRDRLRRQFPDDWRRRLIFTTDPESGKLREMADLEGIETLDLPPDVGGRYSVLSPVGLFPALAVGIDVRALLRGAGRMAERCLMPDIEENPALLGALVHIAADRELGRNMVVLYPYADRLRDWTEWFCQLWAESLGKKLDEEGRVVNTGTTPIKTLGAIDQHSQSQLYMEGPNDKLFVFLRVERFGRDLRFPARARTPEAFRYLSGHSMEELILAEQTATRFALGEEKRQSYQVTLPVMDAETIGQLLFWAEAMTVLAGYIYGVDPFDQPGVELGKKFAYGLMGREGFDSYRKLII